MPLGVQVSIAAELRAIPREMRKESTAAIRKAAGPVLTQAKTNAAWSRRIPKAMRIKPYYSKKSAGVKLVVSAKKAPHGRVYEGATRAASFRHPVHGHRDRWVTQSTRPYAWPAVRAKAPGIQRDLERAIDGVFRRHGFR